MELIEPKRTFSEDTEDNGSEDGFFGHGGFPIIIIRTQSTPDGQETETPPFRPPFLSSGFPFLPPPFLNPARNDEVDLDQPLPGFDSPLFDTFFGPPPPSPSSEDDDDEVIPEERCGILCMMLKNLDAEIKRVQQEVREMKRRKQEEENEIDTDDQDEEEEDDNEGFDVHNSTYTEKVIYIYIISKF